MNDKIVLELTFEQACVLAQMLGDISSLKAKALIPDCPDVCNRACIALYMRLEGYYGKMGSIRHDIAVERDPGDKRQ